MYLYQAGDTRHCEHSSDSDVLVVCSVKATWLYHGLMPECGYHDLCLVFDFNARNVLLMVKVYALLSPIALPQQPFPNSVQA